MKNLNSFFVVCIMIAGSVSVNAEASRPTCDLAVPTSLSQIKETVGAGYYNAEHDLGTCQASADYNTQAAHEACLARISIIANGSAEALAALSCGSPRVISGGCHAVAMDIIQQVSVPMTLAMKMKCDKITACILGSNDTNYIINTLRPLAQSLQCQ